MRRGWNFGEFEFAEQVVVLGAGTSTIIDLDENTGLVIRVRREDFGFLGWNSAVTLDDCGHDTDRDAEQISEVSPKRIAAWTATTYATTSSGLMLLLGSFLLE